jgi:hypothetical protein
MLLLLLALGVFARVVQVPAVAASAAIFKRQCCCCCKSYAHMADTGQTGTCTLEQLM